MPPVATRADALRIIDTFSTVTGFIKVIGTINGVAPIAAAGLCGEGLASLASHNDGKDLCFRAPGSLTYGPTVRCAADGDYLLEDGEDKNKWLRIQARMTFLAATPQQARLFLRKEDGEMVSGKTPGSVNSLNLAIQNVSALTIENVRVWSETPNTTFNLTGSDVAAPNEASSLLVGSMPPNDARELNMKLTIPGGAPGNPRSLVEVQAKWDSF